MSQRALERQLTRFKHRPIFANALRAIGGLNRAPHASAETASHPLFHAEFAIVTDSLSEGTEHRKRAASVVIRRVSREGVGYKPFRAIRTIHRGDAHLAAKRTEILLAEHFRLRIET